MKDFPEYSASARDVLDLFVMDRVKTIFYFEDSDHESVYERLLRNLIPNLREFAVVCLGGKSRVISKAKEGRPENLTAIFVVDKDFDDILGCVQRIDGLYYLDKHCLENYFLDIDALKLICIEESPTELTVSRADRMLYDRVLFLTELNQRYDEITRLFIVVRKHRIEMETTKMEVTKLLEGAEHDYPVPTKEWHNRFRMELQQRCCTTRGTEWLADDQQLNIQLHNAFSNIGHIASAVKHESDHLNGKHLFRCLIRYVQARLSVNIEAHIDTQTIYLRVLTHLKLNEFHPLRDRILAEHPEIVLN